MLISKIGRDNLTKNARFNTFHPLRLFWTVLNVF